MRITAPHSVRAPALALAMVLVHLPACHSRLSSEGTPRTEATCLASSCPCVDSGQCPGSLICRNGACAPDPSLTPDATGHDAGAGTPGDSAPADTRRSDTTGPDGASDSRDAEAAPPPGGLGAYCESNADCDSGWCIDAPEGAYCTVLCGEGCPGSWICKTVPKTDQLAVCVQDVSRLCRPCAEDADCGETGADLCLEIGGGSFCGRDCEGAECPPGSVCTEIPGAASPQCVPANGTCDCDEQSAGASKACASSNAHGTCYGEATCAPALGWVDCSAPEPAPETCDGADNDCDGATDEEQAAEPCEKESEAGVCTGQRTCQGAAGWVCSAREPTPEACNGLDDDCDGSTDEGFTGEGGLYDTTANCGACGVDCAEKLPDASEVACLGDQGAPRCTIVACAPGFLLFNELTCISEDWTLCSQCASAEDCFGEGSLCLQVSESDPRTFCGRACGDDATPCPAGFDCRELAGGGRQCMPTIGSCDCKEANAGQEKPCLAESAWGTCFGVETCDPATGWVGCSAKTPAEEVCNGLDDDCDGLIDEALAPEGGDGSCERESAWGICSGEWRCAGEAGWSCDAPVPAEEVCDGLDDDCDGETDEGFAIAVGDPPVLKYGLSAEHCGVCGYACPPVAHGEVACDPLPEVPVCRVASCEEGFYAYQGIACLAVPTAGLCAPCQSDGDCPGPSDSCLPDDEGEGRCARDCGPSSIYGTAESPCTGATGIRGCCPDGYLCTESAAGARCLPASGSCSCVEDGFVGGCSTESEFGSCFGTRVCQLTGGEPGWGACSAPDPGPELCDGIDNDCDGAADALDDSLDPATTPTGDADCASGPACLGSWVCSGGAWQCTARPAEPEVCDGQDNDCDGETDEDFITGGLYVSDEACGACGLDCGLLVPHSLDARCEVIEAVPTCVAETCEPGYFPFGEGRLCIALVDNLCQACVSDADCLVPTSRCLEVGPERFCGRSCDEGSPYGSTCPPGYFCDELPDGSRQCAPGSGTCRCGPDSLGLERSCPVGECLGRQTCEAGRAGGYGFSPCSAEGVIPEVCDGQDNDCDGATDEGFVGADGRYDTDTDCGDCGNNCLLRWNEPVHHAYGACDASADPPRCAIAACAEGVVDGVPWEHVDTNGLDADGCECRRVPGNLTDDPPDVAFVDAGGAPAYPEPSAVYVDANCDGIDGVIGDAIFVSAANPLPGAGTLANPFRTIHQGLAALPASGREYILVAGGVYEENVILYPGAALHGGYAPDFRSRDIAAFTTEIRGPQPAFGVAAGVHGTLDAVGITGEETVVSGFVIRGYDVTLPPVTDPATGRGYPSYAVYALGSDASLVLRNNVIIGGRGGPGADGARGSNGFGTDSAGGAQLAAADGADASSCLAGVCVLQQQAGGAGGSNPECPTADGRPGGGVTCPVYGAAAYVPADPLLDGAPGYTWTRDSQTDSACYGHLTEAGFPNHIRKLNGGDGLPGPDGAPGLQGQGCLSAAGSFADGGWVGGAATGGAGGAHGDAGGVGGASGGVATASAAEMPADVTASDNQRYMMGATGGGAGAGGCGGTGGQGGGPGGASIALLVAFAAPPAVTSAPVVVANRVVRGPGGNGGTGGYGGLGGLGGDGGHGGDSAGFWVDFRAGDGGRGGTGGEGGGGGGGCGGASFGIALYNHAAAWAPDYGASNAFDLPEGAATGGPGGAAGPSGAPRPTSTGAPGASVDLHAESPY